ncbi:S-adenosyl-L-methionine-dependent methyltransferase [Gilbertella persicaria]|uniref:S-adenosyl-L-methionine-dependent methyltransferase n=1 Tax=Gilbertella persicaria TaxID=101096 RepID=UPI00221FE7B9|nr:S-adenosyl-L-methionine-dependent methyltransferase [Gilbertella persicaria]KAI8082627.1 S-adenosyl-L-methionine-dependent methyltransferase [Gilbertella persicaria]
MPPSLSPSASSTTTNSSSVLSDSAIQMPKSTQRPKRPLSAEILIKIMDQRLYKRQQLEMQRANEHLLMPAPTPQPSSRLNKLMYPKTKKEQPIKKLKSVKKPRPVPMKTMSYVLTQDNNEQDRMVAQHYLLRTAFGSDFKSPIRTQLEKGIVVLDVGCGPGTWTMEMSTAFPKSTFIGIDQEAFYPKDIKPRNCHFRTCGTLVGQPEALILPFPDNSIDYIYQRDLNWGLKGQTWQPLLLEYQRILKPGGWIECVEPDLETQNSLEHECAMNDKLISGLTMRQQDPYAVHRLPTMFAINGFRRVEDIAQMLPLGWGSFHSSSCSSISSAETRKRASNGSAMSQETTARVDNKQHCSEFARAMSSQYLFMLKSLKPWLSHEMNLSSEKYDEYIAGLPAEWKRARTFVNWHCIIAQKPFV